MKKKTYYYHEDQKDDFGNLGINHKPLKDSFVYYHTHPIYRFFSAILYYGIAFPILYCISKIVLRVKVLGKKELKKQLKKKEGYLIYSNHCHYFDAFIPHVLLAFPRRTFVISHADPVNIPFIGKLVMMLGCFPLPNSLTNYKSFSNAIKKVLNDGKVVAIYPEGTLWPYYNQLRPFDKTSFKYAAMNHKPIVACAETFIPSKRKNGRPKMVLTLSSLIYPEENKTIEENTTLFYQKTCCFFKEHVLSENNFCFHEYKPIDEKNK